MKSNWLILSSMLSTTGRKNFDTIADIQCCSVEWAKAKSLHH